MKLSVRTILVDALRDLRRAWPQLVVADLLAKALAVVVLTPCVGLLLKLFLSTTALGVVTDGGIFEFLVHPAGIAALVIVSAVSLAVFFVEAGQLMVIGFGSVEDRQVTWLDGLIYVLRRMPALIEFAWRAVVRLLLIAVPFLGAIGALSWYLLRKYDIHYYLADKPPVFKAAVAAAVLLGTVAALWMLTRIAGWFLALPMVFFDKMGGRQAMRSSEQAMAGQRWRIVLLLVAWFAVLALLSMLVNSVAVRAGDMLIPRGHAHLTLLLTGLSVILLVSGLAHLVLAVFSTTLFPLLVVRLYRGVAGPGALEPQIAAVGTLGEKNLRKIPGKAILGISALVLALVVGGGYVFLQKVDWQRDCTIIAHRGGAAVAPENTLASFKQGIADGADWLELDVQEDAEGVVVVVHDRDFKRVTGNGLAVHEATKDDLATIDVGSYFDPKFADQRVPTLREVLELAKDKAGLFIELKYYGFDTALESKVVNLVEQTGMTDQIVIMSLEYDGVRKTAKLRPNWTYGFLNMVAVGDLTNLDVNFLALASKAATHATIRHGHQRGMKVYAWTIDDPVQMTVMMSRGVDGIITNNVTLARQVQKVRATLTPLGRFIIWMAGESGILSGMEHSSTADDA